MMWLTSRQGRSKPEYGRKLGPTFAACFTSQKEPS
jgi:hypothetical protein